MNPHNPTSPIKPSEPYKSDLAKAIEARPRDVTTYPVSGFFGLGGAPVHKVAFRVNVKSEEDNALVQAHRYVIGLAAGAESAKHDGDLLGDAKTRHALFAACREVTTDAEGNDTITNWPAFPGPEWMASQLTTDQIASLLNLYNQTRAEQAGWLDDFSDETIDDMLEVAAEAGDRNAVARAGLAQLPREQIQYLLERCAIKLRAVRADFDMLSRLDAANAAANPEGT